MLYLPIRALERMPDQLGLPYEDLLLTTSDGVRIHGWLLPAPEDSARAASAGPGGAASLTVLFLHGNAGNISHRFEKVAFLHRCGVDVLLVDYRGYGRSGGKPSEPGLYRDADAAYAELTVRRGLDPRSIVLYGESLGSAVAVDLASREPVGGLILEEAFTSLPDAAQDVYPLLPMRWLVPRKFDSIGKIRRVRCPLLVLHSLDDEFFPVRHAERLFAAAAGSKRRVDLRGSHNDAFIVSSEAYSAGLRTFFAEVHADTTRAAAGPAPAVAAREAG